MRILKLKYVLVAVLVFVFSINAQTNISKLSIDLGIIKNYQNDFGNEKLYAFYPELKVGGQFLHRSLEWELYTSYWTDGITEAFQIRDAATYSFSSQIIGSKLSFYPSEIVDDFFWPIFLTSGISYRKINEKYVGGSDFVGNHIENNSSHLITIDVGGGVYIQMLEKLRLRIETNIFIPLKEDYRLYNHGMNGTLKIGFDYLLKQ